MLENEAMGDQDALVRVLTREGRRVEGVAKSARAMPSRLRAGIQPLTVSDVLFVAGRRHWHVRSALPAMTFPAFRSSLPALSGVVALAALVAEGATEIPDAALYAEVTQRIRDLHTALLAQEPSPRIVRRVAAAILRTLELLGFAPTFDRCGRCGARASLAALSPSSGGVVCGPCASEVPDSRAMSDEALSELRDRKVPSRRAEVRTLLDFLGRFSSLSFPEASGRVRYAVEVLSRSL